MHGDRRVCSLPLRSLEGRAVSYAIPRRSKGVLSPIEGCALSHAIEGCALSHTIEGCVYLCDRCRACDPFHYAIPSTAINGALRSKGVSYDARRTKGVHCNRRVCSWRAAIVLSPIEGCARCTVIPRRCTAIEGCALAASLANAIKGCALSIGDRRVCSLQSKGVLCDPSR